MCAQRILRSTCSSVNMHYVTRPVQNTKPPCATGAINKETTARVARLEIGQHEVSYVAKYETPAHYRDNKQRKNNNNRVTTWKRTTYLMDNGRTSNNSATACKRTTVHMQNGSNKQRIHNRATASLSQGDRGL